MRKAIVVAALAVGLLGGASAAVVAAQNTAPQMHYHGVVADPDMKYRG